MLANDRTRWPKVLLLCSLALAAVVCIVLVALSKQDDARRSAAHNPQPMVESGPAMLGRPPPTDEPEFEEERIASEGAAD